jgi:hypothetical protein
MKKDDFVTKDIEADIVALGYDGIFPIEVRLVSQWLHSKFPNSTYREGYHLWKEDLLKEATLKYPFDDMYYERRNYIIRLAIDEIIKNIPERNNDIKGLQKLRSVKPISQNTKDVIDADLKALQIYLGLGYSIEDSEKAFYKVFEPKSDIDKRRYEIIKKYIENYKKK